MPISSRNLTLSQSINEALFLSMKKYKNVVLIGLGVDDPKGIFGTTKGIKKYFKKNRVFDFPTAENAMTGIAIGSSLVGIKELSFLYYLLNKYLIRQQSGFS